MRQRSGGITILVISLLTGLVAAVLSVTYLRNAARTATVLVATREISAFAELTPTLFAQRQVPLAAVPADAVTDTAGVAGRFTRTVVLEGSVMRQGYLAEATGKTGGWLSARLTETGLSGTRAFAIPVDNTTGVGGTIQPGDRVDIIAAVKLDKENGPDSNFAKVIAAGAPVLYRTDAESTGKAAVIVQITPAQAEEIAFVQLSGTVYLATNPYRPDSAAQNTPGVTPDRFFDRHVRR